MIFNKSNTKISKVYCNYNFYSGISQNIDIVASGQNILLSPSECKYSYNIIEYGFCHNKENFIYVLLYLYTYKQFL